MLLTLTAFTTVVLSIAETHRLQLRERRFITHVLCEEQNSLSSSPGLQEGIHCPAQPLHKSHGHPGCAGIHFPCGKSWMRGTSRLRFLGRTRAPCLECWQCLSIPALALMARTLQLCLHPQSSIPKPGTCCISVAGS